MPLITVCPFTVNVSHTISRQYEPLTTASKVLDFTNYYLLLVECFKLFTPDFKKSGTFMRTHQSPVFIVLDTPHEQIRDPQTQEQVSSPMLFSAGVLPDVKKLENVGMPRLQINGKCPRTLKCLTDSL